jgi:PKD repeat protein
MLEGDAVKLHGSASDPAAANDVLAYSWVVKRLGESTNYASGSGANFTFTPADNGTYVVTMMVSDGDGGVSTTCTKLSIANVSPLALGMTVMAGATFNEGSAIQVMGSASDPAGANDPLAFGWVVKRVGDSGTYASGAGNSFMFTPDDNGTYAVTMTVSDGDGGLSTMTRSFVVNNVAPAATLSAPTPANPVRGQSMSLVANYADPGAHENMMVAWDFGDGSAVAMKSAADAGAMTASHVFTAAGTYTVTVTFRDKDGGIGTATQKVVVGVVAMQADPMDASKTMLVIGGTTANDVIDISIVHKGKSDVTSVKINGVEIGTYSPTGRVMVFGQAGDDQIDASKGPALATEMYGGAGSDTLTGATGASNMLVGGEGNDMLKGGGMRDLLIGGIGADTLKGEGDDDILIAGSTAYDNNLTALRSAITTWMRSDMTYEQRVAALSSDPAFLLNANTVTGDSDVDSLSGGAGRDWFFGNISGGRASADTMHDQGSAEQVVDLSQAFAMAAAKKLLHGHAHISPHTTHTRPVHKKSA